MAAVKTHCVQNLQSSTNSPEFCRGRCPSSAREEVANSPKIPVKSVRPAGGQSRPPLRDTRRCSLAVGADDSVGPMGSCEFAADYHKKPVHPAGSMCTGKRQTHIRNAPSSRTAVTGIDPCKGYADGVNRPSPQTLPALSWLRPWRRRGGRRASSRSSARRTARHTGTERGSRSCA